MDLLQDLRLDEVLAGHRHNLADRPAVVDDDATLTYRELAERVDALASALHARGVAAGDRVVWLGGGSARPLECFLASARVGAVFCPVDPGQPQATLDAILEACDPAVIFGAGSDGHDEYEATLRAHRNVPPAPEVAVPDASMFLLYTMLGRRAVGLQIPRATVLHEAVDVALRGTQARGALHHIAPLIAALAAILAGTTVVASASLPIPRTLLEL